MSILGCFLNFGRKITYFSTFLHYLCTQILTFKHKMSETEHKKASLDHVLKYTGVFGGVQGLIMLMSVVRNKIASAFLGTAGFGLIAIYTSISDFIQSSTNLGIPLASVQHLSELFETGDTDRIRHFVRVVRTWSFWAAIFAVLLTLATAPLLSMLFFEDEPNRAWDIALLSPMVFALTITAGEISILKGLRHLKRVALVSAISAVSTLCLTAPFFWAMGLRGIILSLIVSTCAVTLIHLAFTTPLFPWRISPLSRAVFQEGWPLLRIGIPYVLAALAGTGCAVLQQAFMKKESSEETLGLYRVAYTLMVCYAGIIYSAFESDYFPRLSSVNHDVEARNQVINQQIHVSILLVAPLLIAIVTFLPLIILFLFKDSFLPSVEMAILLSQYMFFRGITTPIGYTALARGESSLYLIMEVIYDIFSLCCVSLCFHYFGLWGAGLGLTLSAIFDLFLIGTCYGSHFHFRFSIGTIRLIIPQWIAVTLSMFSCIFIDGPWRYAIGLSLLMVSCWYSYRILSKESEIIKKFKQKLHL